MVCTATNIDAITKRLGISERTLRKYLKFRDFLFGGTINVSNYEEFLEILRDKIFEKIIPWEALKESLNENAPANFLTIKRIIEKNGNEISFSSAKALFSLLKQAGIISIVPMLRLVSSNVDLVHHFILTKGVVSVGEIMEKFARKTWVIQAIFELFRSGRVIIKGLDVPKEVVEKYEWYNIPVEVVQGCKSINIYVDRSTGEKRAEIVLDPRWKVILNENP